MSNLVYQQPLLPLLLLLLLLLPLLPLLLLLLLLLALLVLQALAHLLHALHLLGSRCTCIILLRWRRLLSHVVRRRRRTGATGLTRQWGLVTPRR